MENPTRSSLPKSTLVDIEEFIKSQMLMTSSSEERATRGHHYIPKFTVDGYGRWREIKNANQDTTQKNLASFDSIGSLRDTYGSLDIQSKNGGIFTRRKTHSQLEKQSTTSNFRHFSSPIGLTDVQLPESGFRHSSVMTDRTRTQSSSQGYKHLSNSLRYNVFPGQGNNQWGSSMKETYLPKSIPSPWLEPKCNFGVQKDAYMQWAEYDVYRQRLMKAWDKYVSEAPKTERTVPEKATKDKKKIQQSKPTKKNKKQKNETAKDKSNKDETKNTEKALDVEPTRIEVQPAESDESFWNFYEKPFNET